MAASANQPVVVTVPQDFAFLRALIDLTKIRSSIPAEIEAEYRRYYRDRLALLTTFSAKSHEDGQTNDVAQIKMIKEMLQSSKSADMEVQPARTAISLSKSKQDCLDLIRAANYAKLIEKL